MQKKIVVKITMIQNALYEIFNHIFNFSLKSKQKQRHKANCDETEMFYFMLYKDNSYFGLNIHLS